jgi:D-alanine-D-alanine ligase-like ATP-grasp enzyme
MMQNGFVPNAQGRFAKNVNVKKQLNYIDVAAAKRYLGERMQEIPAKDIEVTVVGTANIGTGGIAIDVTKRLDPRLKDMAEKMAREVDIPVCGVDFIMNDQEINFIEINASPSFGLHVNPSVGEPQPVVEAFFEWVEAWYASRKS